MRLFSEINGLGGMDWEEQRMEEMDELMLSDGISP